MSDYDFRGFSQSGKDPALQGSADYAFGDSGFSIGAWASNVDFELLDDDIELDLYLNYTGKINDTFAWTTGATGTTTRWRRSRRLSRKSMLGFNAGNFSMKQWYADDFSRSGESAHVHRRQLHRTDRRQVLARVPRSATPWGDWPGKTYEELMRLRGAG